MVRNGFLVKSISYLILVTICYMHFCSSACAIGAGSCHGQSKPGKESCCSHKDKLPAKDCQKFHLSFFNKFSSDNKTGEVKINLIPALEVVQAVNIYTQENNSGIVPCSLFHPPPLRANIRVFIRSFQI
jgi:hypothetical protein